MNNFLVHQVGGPGAFIGTAMYADCEQQSPVRERARAGSQTRSSHENAAECPDEATRVQRVVDLIAQHRSALLQYLVRILSSRQDAEDVFQEACIRLLRVRDLSCVDRYVHAFVFKIATNLAWDCLRRRKVRFHDAHLSYETIEAVAEDSQPDEAVDREMELRVIMRALLRLPPRHQRVFTLHVAEGLSYRSIARRLGVSTKTVERDMSTVLKSCQRRLGTGQHN